VKHLLNKQLKLILLEILSLDVVIIERSQIRPNVLAQFFGKGGNVDVLRGNFERPLSLALELEHQHDEGNVLIVCDEAVVVGVEELKDFDKQVDGRYYLHPETGFNHELNKLVLANEPFHPALEALLSMPASQHNFSEEDLHKKDSQRHLVDHSYGFIDSPEVDEYVLGFAWSQLKDLNQELSNIVLVPSVEGVIVLEKLLKLFNNELAKSLNRWKFGV
jgi:hypothetical protein